MLRKALIILMFSLVCACGVEKKLVQVRRGNVGASMKAMDAGLPASVPNLHVPPKDTLKVTGPDGRQLMIMKAVRDENGEMVATDELAPAVVVASFKHVPERHGKVDLRFLVNVPSSMLDSRWQLRLVPQLHLSGVSSYLDPVIITGERYHKAQLRGYQLYQRFLSSIVTDGMRFVRMQDLECFLERNAPDFYALKRDSSLVSEELQVSLFGVSGAEAVEHYTNTIARAFNRYKLSRKDKVFHRFIKSPFLEGSLRLDTVVRGTEDRVIFEYVQTVKVVPKLRKAQITLEGGIYGPGTKLCDFRGQDTLTFYISSLSTLCDKRERYVTRIVERKVEANSVCWIEFASGSSVLEPGRGNNPIEMGRIRKNLADLLENELYDLDSIVVESSASPEGSAALNDRLSRERSRSVGEYFENCLERMRDSLERDAGFNLSLDGTVLAPAVKTEPIRFVPRSAGENWFLLDRLVGECAEMSEADKEDYFASERVFADPDMREQFMQRKTYYRFLREKLYPHLRTVRFSFHLHRRGMLKDTVHTTEPDTVYRKGILALQEREYEKAVSILRPYADFNTVLAYCAMDYNASALALLETMDLSPPVCYLKALLYSRTGEDALAVESYLKACAGDRAFIYRGSLDPEISKLIKNYQLNNETNPY